uniref:LNS2 domain-containing protein n=1 Tax=Angiostrongylus cantonensis TaxID=6313 RepID=A0A0K0DDA4_ANGCA
MDYAYRVLKNMKYFYNTINPATLSGAIDVIVVEQPDGELKSTPFHVRFGKYGVFSYSNKYVDIQINGEEIDLKMKLGESGVAFFVEEADSHQVPSYMLTSPLPEPGGSQPQSTDQYYHRFVFSKLNSRQSLLEVQQRKRNLPFNSSVFSRLFFLKNESDSEESTFSSSPVHPLLDPRDVDRIADGALSDSEVDRHRNTPEPHANDVTDWKWGQLPETRVGKLKQEQGKAAATLNPLSEDEFEDSSRSYMLSLRLSSEKLRSLGLVYGANECRFSITTKFQGTSWCSCNIYLYKWYERIVISDIDGTITKSDVLGHVIPAIGGTWAHAGVAELYTRIKNNGYKMVYLSSRAIGQSHTTKQYLKSIAQDSKQLPDGPVLLSPTSVLVAFRREVIERRPEEFKIAALSDLKKLFSVKQPFFAGFGNRETDVTTYLAVGIMPARILIIDPSGRVRRSDSVGYVSNYSSMATETVDYLFPPLMKILGREGGRIPRCTSWPDTQEDPSHDEAVNRWEHSS